MAWQGCISDLFQIQHNCLFVTNTPRSLSINPFPNKENVDKTSSNPSHRPLLQTPVHTTTPTRFSVSPPAGQFPARTRHSRALASASPAIAPSGKHAVDYRRLNRSRAQAPSPPTHARSRRSMHHAMRYSTDAPRINSTHQIPLLHAKPSRFGSNSTPPRTQSPGKNRYRSPPPTAE